MMTPRYLITALALMLAFALSACDTGGTVAADDGPAVATTEVAVQDNQFEPAAIEVAVGDTVTWTWEGDSDHNVVGDGFSSDVQREGTFAQQFDAPGTYAYRCTLHGGMDGRVVVVDGGA